MDQNSGDYTAPSDDARYDTLDMIESDTATKKDASNQQLTELALLIEGLREKEKKVAELEDRLKAVKQEVSEISKIKIPDFFDSIGMDGMKLKTGEVITIKRGFAASISKANQEEAFAWLRKNGHDGIIKKDVTVHIKKGEQDEALALNEHLAKEGYTFTNKEGVHPMTLKAFVTEQMGAGTDLPQDKFGVFPLRETKIK